MCCFLGVFLGLAGTKSRPLRHKGFSSKIRAKSLWHNGLELRPSSSYQIFAAPDIKPSKTNHRSILICDVFHSLHPVQTKPRKVILVTLAKDPWVVESCKNFFPSTGRCETESTCRPKYCTIFRCVFSFCGVGVGRFLISCCRPFFYFQENA